MDASEPKPTDAQPDPPESVKSAPAEKEPVDVAGRPVGIRWWPAAAILALAAVIEGAVWSAYTENRPIQSVSMYLTVIGVCLLLLGWWIFFSRVRWRTRFIGLGVVVLLAIAARLSLRVDEFSGAVYPMLAFRWTPTAEERAAEYRDKLANENHLSEKLAGKTIVAEQGDWQRFRGADRHGNVPAAGIRTNWDEQPPTEVWRHPIGLGWSSFIVVGGLAYTQEQRLDDEAVVCYDADTGAEVWTHLDETRFSESMGSDGPRATPTFFDSKIYAQGATGILNCLDAATGDVIWSKNILDDAGSKVLTWGMAGSPLVFDDLVVVNAGGNNDAALVAYDRHNGERVWAAGNGDASYSSPRLVEIDGQRQILNFAGDGLFAHDAETGRELWSFPWVASPKVNAVVPYLVDDSQILIASGYGMGATLLDVRRDGDAWTAEQVWKSIRLKAKFNDVVVRDGYVYGLDEGVLTCLDLKTGERIWKSGRFGYGQILLLDDLLLVLTESGEVLLIKAEPKKSQPIARFQAIEGKTWNHPTLVRGRLYVRNAREAACYDISK